MKLPKIQKLPSGSYFCRLRIKDEYGVVRSVPITDADYNIVQATAMAYKTGLLKHGRLPSEDKSLRVLVRSYVQEQERKLSPSTIAGYYNIERNRFKDYMDRPFSSIKSLQRMIDAELETVSSKTVQNAWGLVAKSLKHHGISFPQNISIPKDAENSTPYLRPAMIPTFVKAAFEHELAVPMLLALSSMRSSEIVALRWEDIPIHPAMIRTNGAAVRNSNNELVYKKAGKSISASRNVPIFIPELKEAIERDRLPDGPVLFKTQNVLYKQINKLCRENGLPEVGIHGLRRSFASLAYFLKLPERVAMEIGGWKDLGTMHKHYVKIAQDDIDHYGKELEAFYTANKAK